MHAAMQLCVLESSLDAAPCHAVHGAGPRRGEQRGAAVARNALLVGCQVGSHLEMGQWCGGGGLGVERGILTQGAGWKQPTNKVAPKLRAHAPWPAQLACVSVTKQAVGRLSTVEQ